MRVLFVCAALIAPTLALAQTPAGPLTLEQVLQLAEERSESLAIARAAVSRAEAEQIRARSGLFPQLSAMLSYDRALASEFEGVFDNVTFGGAGAEAPEAPEGADGGGLEDLPFGRRNTWRVTLSFSQNLFDFGRIAAGRDAAGAGRAAADIGMTTARAQLLFDVTQAYYDAALADRMVAIAEATVAQAGATLQQTEAGFRAGTQPEFEVLRARVARDTQNTSVIRARANRQIALLRLKQMLDLPATADLQLADSLADERLLPAPTFATRLVAAGQPAVPAADRAAVQEAATTVTLREASMRAAKAERLPSISANSSYGRVAYPSDFLPTFDRLNWSVGFALQVPVLTGGRQRASELSAAADLEQARARLQQVRELAELDTQSALAELAASQAAWDATAGTVQQANRAYELANIRYGAGVSTQLELSDARLLLQQAEANRAQAGRDLQVARARVALLPDLPLGAGAATGGGGTTGQPAAPAVPQQQAPAGGGQVTTAAARGGAASFGGTQ
ncbi:MAG: TolC family protein [Vicinamibacterales bacterium]